MSAPLEEYRFRLREAVSIINDLKTKLAAAEAAIVEPIAIIGMACRFPGPAHSPEEFIQLLMDGLDAVTEVPATRWQVASDEQSDDSAERATRWGAFIPDVELFDAEFFGISPREAARMDPQQRLLLELTWETLERAGYVPDQLVGSRTGIFLGLMNNDYSLLDVPSENAVQDPYRVTGNGHCFPAGRLSYTFGFQGPSLVVDTACSSSLVAIHLACGSLRARESTLALAGGVNLMLSSTTTRSYSKLQALSVDGRCKTFDATANGFVRGEGAGLVLLKRLSDARRDGDPILALIRSTAVNQDGRSTGITTPNVLAQELLLQTALKNANLQPSDIGYIETHGTGTPLGDPIEVDALRTVFGALQEHGSSCVLGAVKTNIGHLEAAAGIAGLIKVAMVFRHGVIPKVMHFKTQNPRIDLKRTSLTIAREHIPWPQGAKPRRAGVSSFGLSGTNAHVILEEAPDEMPRAPAQEQAPYLLPLSARSLPALSAMASTCAKWFASAKNAALLDVVSTASRRRSHHEHRLAIVARTHEEFVEQLLQHARITTSEANTRAQASLSEPPKVVFIFPGQGSQWLGMGRRLLVEEPVFRGAFEDCDAPIQRIAGFSILEQLKAGESQSRLDDIDVVQPLLFATEVALATLWQSWGIKADCVVGHSMGEVAAAHVAGMVNLEDAIKIICRRSQVLKRISGKGAMGFVELAAADAMTAIAGYETQLDVAVSNGPRSTVLSGDPHALDDVLAKLGQRGTFCRRVKVDVASHSPQVEPLRHELLNAFQDLRPTTGSTAMRSTVTGKPVQGVELLATYWWNNLRQTVRFSQVIQDLVHEGYNIFVEVSPHPILVPAIEENIEAIGGNGTAIASLRRHVNERQTLLEALGQLYVRRYDVDWKRVHPERQTIISFPTYPWQRERFWVHPQAASDIRAHTQLTRRSLQHPILGNLVQVAAQPDSWFWQGVLSLASFPFLKDHRIGDDVVLPGAFYVEAALAAAAQHLESEQIVIEDLAFLSALKMRKDDTFLIEVALQRMADGAYSFRYSSTPATADIRQRTPPAWTLHASGMIRGHRGVRPNVHKIEIEHALRQCNVQVPMAEFEQLEAALGLKLGPAFRGIREVRRSETSSIGWVESSTIPATNGAEFLVHPAVLDMAFRSAIIPLISKENLGHRVLAHVMRVEWFRPVGEAVWSLGQAHGDAHPSVALVDQQGDLCMSFEGVEMRALPHPLEAMDRQAHLLFSQTWTPVEQPAITKASGGRWLLFFTDPDFGERTRRSLTALGSDVTLVIAHDPNEPPPASHWTFNPTDPESILKSLHAAVACGSLSGIVYSCDPKSDAPNLFDGNIGASGIRAYGGALHLVQGLASLPIREFPHLFFVVRGIQSIDNEPNNGALESSIVWGIGRALTQDYPDIACTRIDLDPLTGADDADLLAKELSADRTQEELAFRGGRRFVGRLERYFRGSRPSVQLRLREDATYLVAISDPHIRLHMVQVLANLGARHVALISPAEIAQSDLLVHLKAAGIDLLAVSTDIRNAERLKMTLHDIEARMPVVRGVIHIVDALETKALARHRLDTMKSSLSNVLLGAWNVHTQTLHYSLDFFVLCSAMNGLLGERNHGTDTVVTAFFDALVSHRCAHGKVGTSIAWGPMAIVADDAHEQSRALVHGWQQLSADDVSVILSRAVEEKWQRVGAAFLDIRQWVQQHPEAAAATRLEMLTAEARSIAPNSCQSQSNELLERLAKANPADRLALLESHIRSLLASILRMDAARIHRLAPLRAVGIDSLMSLELRNRLESDLAMKLSATIVWAHPNIAAMAEHLCAKLAINEPKPKPAPKAPESEPKTNHASTSLVPEDDLLQSFDKSMSRVSHRRKK